MNFWENIDDELLSKDYICGYCGCYIASQKGYEGFFRTGPDEQIRIGIYLCPKCVNPTYFDKDNKQYPMAKAGNDVLNINDERIKGLYEEARNSFSVKAFTSVALCCRKLLMNVAVYLGAEENRKFIFYVDWLDRENYILPNSKKWVDQIRKIGNEATHEICIISKEDAEKTLFFTEMLLKMVYEFPAMVE
ncbi:DUF4145 domain-containing protein [Clostridioides difficile]|uniref:DUF4145 domain-containing protein n=1 Tax=Clostridioides difficile TaxID=1496 RepID=UPI0008A40EFB|nr:DUF4145 domain-containing protein [Clostridioides difficile]OFU27763.1 hypothetical protein HMPREF3075_14795 [Clostridium sp. HMSC19B11]EGT3846030.1 DUF4145 domain-containing protein [Clostridioides difficile]EGT4699283.1 DUF4145 domain-containing protein [Clostridioides difficile]EGT4914666.1 DUF4145 domain-containing protein [Clostridioides difficile]MBH7452219.1 DUF4145 domain-containing protein [Clostridioides difficile]